MKFYVNRAFENILGLGLTSKASPDMVERKVREQVGAAVEGDGRAVADNPAWWRSVRERISLQSDSAR